MRICYLADPAWVMNRRVVSSIAARGHEVHFVVPYYAKEPSPDGFPVHSFSMLLDKPADKKLMRAFKFRMRKFVMAIKVHYLIQELKPDVVHGIFATPDYGSWATFSGIHPQIQTLMGCDVNRPEIRPSTRFRRWMYLRGLRSADVLVSSTEVCFENAYSLTKVKRRTEIIQWGISLNTFTPCPPRLVTRASLGISPSDLVVFSARGMTDSRLNHETVIRAIAKASTILPKLYCIFTGFNCISKEQHNYLSSLRKLGSELGIEGRLQFLEVIPYEVMPDYYRLSDVLINIPKSDGFPSTIFEAMACRCPVLCGNLPAYRDIIRPDRNAIQVDHLNPDSVAEGLIRVLTHRTLAESLRDEGEKTVRKHGNIEIEMDKLDALYRSLTNTS